MKHFQFKPLTVQADPIWQGKHPYHDSRFITTQGDRLVKLAPLFHSDDPDRIGFEDGTKGASIICEMRDCEGQAEYARLFASAPELLTERNEALDECRRLSSLLEQTQREVKELRAQIGRISVNCRLALRATNPEVITDCLNRAVDLAEAVPQA